MQERREKGLCYYCDDKYNIGHKCNQPKVYLLKGWEIKDVAGPAEQGGQIQEGEAFEAQGEEGELPDLVGKVFLNGRPCYAQRTV